MTEINGFIPAAEVENAEHYAYVTRSAVRLFNAGALSNVVELVVEPEYGYTTRLTYDDDSFRVTYGNDLGLNRGAACDLAKDKGHAKAMLRTIGVNTPAGSEFLLPWWAEAIGPSQNQRGNNNLRTVDSAPEYIETELGYPVYIKPANGSKGLGVVRAEDEHEALQTFSDYETQRVHVAIVEESVDLPDYRLVVLDGELISAYSRKPLMIVGNGANTIEELIAGVQERYREDGRDTVLDIHDPRIAQRLNKYGLTLASVVPEQRELALMAISNLSAGGTSEDVTEIVHGHWRELAAFVARNFNLRFCGVDLACADITEPAGPYSVYELNAAPGLDHYASSGSEQKKIVDELYTTVLNAYPRTGPRGAGS